MERNVGGLDRKVRLVAGAVLVLAGVLVDPQLIGLAVRAVVLVVGLVLLGTGATQKCIINQLLGVDTAK